MKLCLIGSIITGTNHQRFSHMNKILLLPLLTLALHAGDLSAQKDTERAPNIVIILADDFGVGDIQIHYPQQNMFMTL